MQSPMYDPQKSRQLCKAVSAPRLFEAVFDIILGTGLANYMEKFVLLQPGDSTMPIFQ